MKHVRGFLVSLLFAAFAFLAFKPLLIVDIQSKVSPFFEDASFIAPEIVSREPPDLPETPKPDAENLPRIENFERIAKHDVWVGDSPCGEDIFSAPLSLPGLGPRQDGPFLANPITAGDNQIIVNQPTFLFKTESGVTLKLVQPVISYYDVSGRRFRDARKYIFDRQPLDSQRLAGEEVRPETRRGRLRVATVAGILSPSSLSYTISGSRDRYRLVVNKTELTSAFLVTLPRWKNYGTASASDRSKWDDLLCNAAHHELGHLRIRLDILSETLDGYAGLPPAHSRAEMESLTVEFRKEISGRVQDRQEAYHVYNGGGTRRGMTELPYADLPFPWLETDDIPVQEN